MAAETTPRQPTQGDTAISINDERAQRRARRQALIDAGINPYPIASTITSHAADLIDTYADLADGQDTEDVVSIAGRVRAFRDSGKICFVVLEDVTGEMQLFCRIDNFEEDNWALLKGLDLGDIVEATGPVVRTRRGQLSVSPTSVRMLSKSLRPLPEKFHGLTDREVRYRQRYVDLIMNPEVRETMRKRSQIVSLIRRYMEEDGYIEVETPMMHNILGGANAKPFVTHFNALDNDFYLRIATELPLKRLIVGGMERVFEIGRQFRNEGMDLTHNPEFTSMEAYCAYSDLDGMKRLTEGLFKTLARQVCGCEEGKEVITYQGQTVDMSGTWASRSLADIASEVVGVHIDMDTPLDQLRALCDKYEIEWGENWGAGKLIFELYDELGEKTLVNPTFVCDYPEEVSPLSKRKDDDPRLTDRFELVICGHEYANAFSELNDPVDQAGRFAEQVAAKGFGDDEAMGYDYDYVRALEYGMPPAGGIGYGIDRMVMLFCDQASIRDVLLFPQMKPEVITREQIAEQVEGATSDNPFASVDAIAAASEAGASAEKAAEAAAGEAAEGAEAEDAAEDEEDEAPAAEGAAEAAAAEAPSYKDVSMEGKLEAGITREAAVALLNQYNQDEYHIKHGMQLEGLMRYYADRYDPDNVEFWGIVGMLHDLDWEQWPNDDLHTVKTAEILVAAGGTPQLARAIQTHNSDLNEALPTPDHKMERVLYAVDELSGLINACVNLRPSHSVTDMNLKSLKKKFKTKSFAAGCDREVIARGADYLDMDLADLFADILEAEKALVEVNDFFE